MKFKLSLVVIFLWEMNEILCVNGQIMSVESQAVGNETLKPLSRQRRYIVFPKGSSLQLVFEALAHVPTHFRLLLGPTWQIAWPMPSETLQFNKNRRSAKSGMKKYKIYSELISLFNLLGMTLGLAWQLPDDPQIHLDHKKKDKIYKRNVYKKMEGFIKPFSSGSDGKQCVLKALCESGQRTPSKKEFAKEILHKIFSINDDDESEDTHEDNIYKRAHRSTNQNCEALYPGCEFSIFEAVST